MVEPSVVENAVRTNIDGVSVLELEDLTGGKNHYQMLVVASAFEGQNRVARHQMVYAALGDMMSGPVHALALKTLTPAEHAG